MFLFLGLESLARRCLEGLVSKLSQPSQRLCFNCQFLMILKVFNAVSPSVTRTK